MLGWVGSAASLRRAASAATVSVGPVPPLYPADHHAGAPTASVPMPESGAGFGAASTACTCPSLRRAPTRPARIRSVNDAGASSRSTILPPRLGDVRSDTIQFVRPSRPPPRLRPVTPFRTSAHPASAARCSDREIRSGSRFAASMCSVAHGRSNRGLEPCSMRLLRERLRGWDLSTHANRTPSLSRGAAAPRCHPDRRRVGGPRPRCRRSTRRL